MIAYFIIPLHPAVKKNSQRICINKRTNKPFILQSKLHNEYEEAASYYLQQQRPPAPINKPVTVCAKYYVKDHRKRDTTNLNQCLHDLLVKNKILADDNYNIIASTDGTRVYYDKDNPRTEITITEYLEA